MAKNQEFKGKKLYRSVNNKIIAGVCGGIGEYFNIDPTVIRLIWAFVKNHPLEMGGMKQSVIPLVLIGGS